MRRIYHASDSRATARREGFVSRRTFTYEVHDDPRRTVFGCLHGLNEEWLAPGKGIPLHAHENMEIISLPISGTLRHRDSRGISHIIPTGHVHVLSAGLGVTHWEHNHEDHELAHYVQVWIRPRSRGTPTAYAEGAIDRAAALNGFFLAAAPRPTHAPLPIDQDAYVSTSTIEPGRVVTYRKYLAGNGLYVFVIDGQVTASSYELTAGDGLGVLEFEKLDIGARRRSQILCVEVPMISAPTVTS
ncbi:MAG TPA: pirin family protein [Gammaproteobacteria bacterium]